MVQFGFLFFVAFVNFMAGVGAAVYLGKAPRDWGFLAQLLEALRRHKLSVRGAAAELSPMVACVSEPSATELPAVESPRLAPQLEAPVTKPSTMEPVKVVARVEVVEPVEAPDEPDDSMPSSDADTSPAPGELTQIALEEMIIDMAAREVHLRQIAQQVTGEENEAFDWEALLSEVNEDIQKLLRHFNEARYLVEQARVFAADARQTCLGELDAHWDAINQQSMQLLIISSEPDPPDADRHHLVAICEGVLRACRDTRQSCAAYLAHASLERPLVST